MGKALADEFRVAREIFDRVDAALNQKLSRLMFEGPEDELTLTANAQPALMATSIAALRVLETETGFNPAREAAYVAGHSLGEYSALCAAGSLTSKTRRASCACAARRCRRLFRSAKARWRPFSVSISGRW